ncbi:MAG: hypothetical protein EA417_01420 [Gammaproteobacteria bacterium]|nr:MAG: hypothetical protein EA417_01420 [Gammaproteobacteria bacterium]
MLPRRRQLDAKLTTAAAGFDRNRSPVGCVTHGIGQQVGHDLHQPGAVTHHFEFLLNTQLKLVAVPLCAVADGVGVLLDHLMGTLEQCDIAGPDRHGADGRVDRGQRIAHLVYECQWPSVLTQFRPTILTHLR